MQLLKQCADLLYKISPRCYYSVRYFCIRKEWPDFKNPTNLSEFLLSEMLKPEFKRFAEYADKIKVRQYIINKGFPFILPKLYGVWDTAQEIDFERLPEKFALKVNNGCGHHILCKDKRELSIPKTRRLLTQLIKKPYSIREPHYPYITPKIYAEELIENGDNSSLTDYKFMCVKGKIECILVCSNRSSDFHKIDRATVDKTWEPLPWIIESSKSSLPSRPKHLEEMNHIAESLSADFDFVRVDLYDTGKQVYFGELTFTPNSSLLTFWTKEAITNMVNDLK